MLLKVGDNISTDEISPAGARALPFRSNIPKLAMFSFTQIDDSYPERAQQADETGHIIVGGENYGQGSSREHAAIAPRHLGLRAVIAKSFARIHGRISPTSASWRSSSTNADDYESIDQDDTLRITGLRDTLADKDTLQVDNLDQGFVFHCAASSFAAASQGRAGRRADPRLAEDDQIRPVCYGASIRRDLNLCECDRCVSSNRLSVAYRIAFLHWSGAPRLRRHPRTRAARAAQSHRLAAARRDRGADPADAASGRRASCTPRPVARHALEQGIPVLRPPRPNTAEFVAELSELAPDCCPVVAYGALLRDELLAVPAHGWVNLHFSLLPAWRGAAPVQAAIAAGDTVTGATTFQIEAGLDSGPVYGVVTEAVRPIDTAGDCLTGWRSRVLRCCPPRWTVSPTVR